MDVGVIISRLLGVAVLLPLMSFVFTFIFGRRLGNGKLGAHAATFAIVSAFVLSMMAFCVWVSHHPPAPAEHHGNHTAVAHAGDETHDSNEHEQSEHADVVHGEDDHGHADYGHGDAGHAESHDSYAAPHYSGDWYTLGIFGDLRMSIGYYIDSLTVCMFCMVTLIASCIHFYATGYMHEELHDVKDHEVTLSSGEHLHRPGRYHRFFQSLSLFCFSMLGLVISGNIAMTFVFWELVGICSYFLIGFYVERHSASTAANKAFIVNRVGDFGMIIGLLALWSSLGTFSFSEIFSEVRSPENNHALAVPDGMVLAAAEDEVTAVVRSLPRDSNPDVVAAAVGEKIDEWRNPETSGKEGGYGYWLLVIAGVGIFCGCVGKSAQFPLHVWLPDAMEGPTPVSALVHSATMVAAGVFLVARFYPVFTPEVLLIIAVSGCVTLFIGATIAITATDIKRVLAYSTVSQLGYMMLALGLGGWLAGVLHLFTHAFFKSLLFMCSGSVIHAVHTNEMPQMGGLRKKMPWTSGTMLIGCLAIAGAGIPFVIGLSGYYSKDAILEQALSFGRTNGGLGMLFFYFTAGGAAITAFYMFRLWYMTFAGEPRNKERYDHAHESPKVMYVPLVILSVFAIGVAWKPFFTDLNLVGLLEQARPAGTLPAENAVLLNLSWPNEHDSHASAIKVPATWVAFGTALAGFLLATVFYGVRRLNPDDVRRQFKPIHSFLINKWWFDELYQWMFIWPTHVMSRLIAGFDRWVIDSLIHSCAWTVRVFSVAWDRVADQGIVDGFANSLASVTYSIGSSLRGLQTGSLRQYVLFIVGGTVLLFAAVSFL